MNEDEPKRGFLDKQVDTAVDSMQRSWDKCTVCGKRLPPGTPTIKLYDDNIGDITVDGGCSLKAILWYVRKLYSEDKVK